jgi:predicted nucleic acid-binding protein
VNGCCPRRARRTRRLTSAFDADRTLRRVRPDRHTRRLAARTPSPVLSDDVDPSSVGPVLLDTCVFIDNGRNTLPQAFKRLLTARGLIHVSSITGLELAFAFGRLDPANTRTDRSLHYLHDALAMAPAHRLITASPADHILAGILASTLTRTQGLGTDARRKLLFESLLLASALRNGLTLLTANHRDFDLLSQLLPDGKVAYYRTLARR